MANQMQLETTGTSCLLGPSVEERRKYGVVLPTAKMDQELRDLLETASKKHKKGEFNQESFGSTICPGIRRHCKDSSNNIFLLNAVSLDKLGYTERAFFLAADFQAVKQPDGGFVVQKVKEEALVKDNSELPGNHPFIGAMQTRSTAIQASSETKVQLKPEQKTVIEPTPEPAHQVSTMKEDDELRTNGRSGKEQKERDFCECKNGWSGDQGEKMFECDGECNDWYHPQCISMTKCEQNIIDLHQNVTWLCRKCAVGE